MTFEKPKASIGIILITLLISVASIFYTPRLTMWIIFAAVFVLLWLNPNKFKTQTINLDKYPLLSKSLRQRLIIFWVIGMLAMATLSELTLHLTLSPLISFPLGITLFIFSAYSAGNLIYSRYQMLMQSDTNNADERDIQNKNRAYKLAFRIIIIGSFIVFYLVPDIGTTFFDLPDEARYLPYYLGRMSDFTYILIWILIGTIPALIYAWLEPDPIPDNITSGDTL